MAEFHRTIEVKITVEADSEEAGHRQIAELAERLDEQAPIGCDVCRNKDDKIVMFVVDRTGMMS